MIIDSHLTIESDYWFLTFFLITSLLYFTVLFIRNKTTEFRGAIWLQYGIIVMLFYLFTNDKVYNEEYHLIDKSKAEIINNGSNTVSILWHGNNYKINDVGSLNSMENENSELILIKRSYTFTGDKKFIFKNNGFFSNVQNITTKTFDIDVYLIWSFMIFVGFVVFSISTMETEDERDSAIFRYSSLGTLFTTVLFVLIIAGAKDGSSKTEWIELGYNDYELTSSKNHVIISYRIHEPFIIDKDDIGHDVNTSKINKDNVTTKVQFKKYMFTDDIDYDTYEIHVSAKESEIGLKDLRTSLNINMDGVGSIHASFSDMINWDTTDTISTDSEDSVVVKSPPINVRMSINDFNILKEYQKRDTTKIEKQ